MAGLMGSLAGMRPILHVERAIMGACIRASTGVGSIAAASPIGVAFTAEAVSTGVVSTGAVEEGLTIAAPQEEGDSLTALMEVLQGALAESFALPDSFLVARSLAWAVSGKWKSEKGN